jgi:hypothetical protein
LAQVNNFSRAQQNKNKFNLCQNGKNTMICWLLFHIKPHPLVKTSKIDWKVMVGSQYIHVVIQGF